MSDIPELCKKIGSILESMYSASLTRDQHASDLATKELRKRFKKNPFLRLPPSRAMQIPPDPYEKLDFRSFVSETLCHCNGIHNHSFTCYKGTMGYSGCRLCKPSGLRKETLPVILEVDEDKEAKKYAYKKPPSETITPLRKRSRWSKIFRVKISILYSIIGSTNYCLGNEETRI